MKFAAEVKDPTNYFQLLRALFRSIGGGKFEFLYKEFLPLLPGLSPPPQIAFVYGRPILTPLKTHSIVGYPQ